VSLLSALRDRLFGEEPPVDPAARALVEQLAAEVRAAGIRDTQPPDQFAAGRLLLDGGPAERVERVRALLDARKRTRDDGLSGKYDAQKWAVHGVLDTALKRLLRVRQPYTQRQLAELLRLAARTFTAWGSWEFPLGSVLSQVPAARAGGAIDAELARRLKDVRRLAARRDTAEHRRMLAQIDAVLRGDAEKPLEAGGPAGAAILTDVRHLPDAQRAAWTELLSHGREIDSAAPTAEWLARGRALVETISDGEFTRVAGGWLAAGPAPGAPRDAQAIDADAELLKGLVWAASTVESPPLAVMIGDLAVACFRKIPGVGPVSKKLGNACLGALGRMPGLDGVAQLGRVRTAVKYAEAHRLIDKAIGAAATRRGVPATDLEELAVPTFGFDEHGVRRQAVGAATAELVITGSVDVELAWIAASGRRQASVPADVRTGHREALAELRKAAQDTARMLQAQRDRIEAMFLAPRTWEAAAWRARYLDHPLVAGISRRLIWRVRRGDRTTEAIWRDGKLVDVDGEPVDVDGAEILLWHPLDGEIGTVTAWRRWLEAHEVTQPFKQAHREVYLLTHAERETRMYSNRFAAHIVRQHQLAALCRERGWRYALQGAAWDGHNVPVRDLPGGTLRAEFWVDAPADAETSPAGVSLQLVTDQVRFVDRAGEPHPLADIPTRVFSEVMRDVDLFVGVTSIAADPTWQDTGARTGPGEYWRETAFGGLSVSAQVRREVLASLLPKLRIAERCTLDDRFLVVRGDMRTYRIHLGSANVMMEPGSQYLCIVPGRQRAGFPSPGKVYLPFEGDLTLSIILSKALLLAADASILDPTILAQIKRRPS
jgi:hypothetical protein